MQSMGVNFLDLLDHFFFILVQLIDIFAQQVLACINIKVWFSSNDSVTLFINWKI